MLYWRGMPAIGSLSVSIDAVAVVPGTFTGQSSSAYLYYTDERKAWAPGVRARISPAQRTQG